MKPRTWSWGEFILTDLIYSDLFQQITINHTQWWTAQWAQEHYLMSWLLNLISDVKANRCDQVQLSGYLESESFSVISHISFLKSGVIVFTVIMDSLLGKLMLTMKKVTSINIRNYQNISLGILVNNYLGEYYCVVGLLTSLKSQFLPNPQDCISFWTI